MVSFAGVFLGLAFGLAWAALFVPELRARRQWTLQVGIVSGAYLACFFGMTILLALLDMRDRYLFSTTRTLIAAFAVLGSYAAVTAVGRRPWSILPVWSVVFLSLTAWAPERLHDIAQSMWTPPRTGSVGYGGEMELAAVHLFVAAVAVGLSVVLWILCWRWTPRTVMAAAAATLAFLLFAGLAVYQTVPRHGEGVSLWFLVIPIALLAAGLTLLTCILISILCAVRRPRKSPGGFEVVR